MLDLRAPSGGPTVWSPGVAPLCPPPRRTRAAAAARPAAARGGRPAGRGGGLRRATRGPPSPECARDQGSEGWGRSLDAAG